MSFLVFMLKLARILHRRGGSAPAITDDQVKADVGSALAGELQITRESNSWGQGELLTIEPRPGQRIVIGTVRQGKPGIKL